MKTRGAELLTDDPNHATRPKGSLRVEFQADDTQLLCSTGANVLIMVLKSTSGKLPHLYLAIGDIVCG